MNNKALERIDCKQNQFSYDTFLQTYRYGIVKKHVQDFSGQATLLDCACGSGYGAELLKGHTSYIGVDVSSEAIDFARKNYGEYGEFCLCDGLRLPFSDGAFEIISSLETIEHLPKNDHCHFISELLRVLKPGGRIIITSPNRNYLYKKHLKRRGWHNPYHHYEYELKEFLEFIKSFANLTVEKAYTIGFPVPLPERSFRLHKLPRRVFESIASAWISLGVCCCRWSNSIVLIAQKK